LKNRSMAHHMWRRSFRAVCYHLQREVIKKFPQSKYIVLTVRVHHT
jgi:hypothetical protein